MVKKLRSCPKKKKSWNVRNNKSEITKFSNNFRKLSKKKSDLIKIKN